MADLDWLDEVRLHQRVSKAAEVREVPCYHCGARVRERCRPLRQYNRGGPTPASVTEHAHRRSLRWHVALILSANDLTEHVAAVHG